jgi:hypothetical protein
MKDQPRFSEKRRIAESSLAGFPLALRLHFLQYKVYRVWEYWYQTLAVLVKFFCFAKFFSRELSWADLSSTREANLHSIRRTTHHRWARHRPRRIKRAIYAPLDLGLETRPSYSWTSLSRLSLYQSLATSAKGTDLFIDLLRQQLFHYAVVPLIL